MNFCPTCGAPVALRVPAGEDRERHVCTAPGCARVHYVNPRVVVGVVAPHEGRVLLCRRAIEPRTGFWTLPAGFLETGETTAEGARREAWEEARARVEVGPLLALYDLPHIAQVQLFYLARLLEPGAVAPGPESLEVGLFGWDEVPWADLAFPSVHWALRYHHAVAAGGGPFPAEVRGRTGA